MYFTFIYADDNIQVHTLYCTHVLYSNLVNLVVPGDLEYIICTWCDKVTDSLMASVVFHCSNRS